MFRRFPALFLLLFALAFNASPIYANAPLEPAPAAPVDSPKINETDYYLDINTGKTFRVIYDNLNETYTREDLFPLDLFVNTRTLDTFWLPQAVVVNNVLIQDMQGKYKVDPRKVKRQGDGYIIIDGNSETRVKDNGTVYKLERGGKVKSTGSEQKMKEDGIKVKANDKETKLKTDDMKVKVDNKTGDISIKETK